MKARYILANPTHSCNDAVRPLGILRIVLPPCLVHEQRLVGLVVGHIERALVLDVAPSLVRQPQHVAPAVRAVLLHRRVLQADQLAMFHNVWMPLSGKYFYDFL